MLEIIGTIAGNALSLPGILGLAFGMMTRNPVLAAIIGVVVGFAETLIFAKFDFMKVEPLELIIAVGVGVLAGCLGSLIRIKGASV